MALPDAMSMTVTSPEPSLLTKTRGPFGRSAAGTAETPAEDEGAAVTPGAGESLCRSQPARIASRHVRVRVRDAIGPKSLRRWKTYSCPFTPTAMRPLRVDGRVPALDGAGHPACWLPSTMSAPGVAVPRVERVARVPHDGVGLPSVVVTIGEREAARRGAPRGRRRDSARLAVIFTTTMFPVCARRTVLAAARSRCAAPRRSPCAVV